MVIYVGLGFCGVLIVLVALSSYLRLQTRGFINVSSYHFNRFLNCELSLDDYNNIRNELRSGTSPLLRWYMKKVGVLDEY